MATTRKVAAKPAAKNPASKKPTVKKTTAPKTTAAKRPAAKKPAAPKKPVAKKPVEKKTAAKKPVAKKPAAKKPAAKKPAAKEVVRRSAQGFKVAEYVVYPAHGVGQVTEIVTQEVAGMSLEMFVVNFEKEKMVLRVPLDKATQIGMRKLAEPSILDGAMKTLKGRARVKRTMWSRRAQEYEAKINSGDLIAISEVVRDLFRNENQPEQSYSERQLYERALERMAREVATIDKVTEDEAIVELEAILAKTTGGARRQPDTDGA
ncbi:MAG: CarD family transcriptional regulator [Parvibaculales bacterium]